MMTSLRSRAAGGVAVLFTVTLVTACSDDDATKKDSGVNKDAQVDSWGGQDNGTDAESQEVPPVKMLRDPSTCPTGYTTTAPVAGANTDFEVAGQSRTFELRLPDAATYTGPRPLLVYFHGTDGLSTDINGFGFADLLVERGFIVVGPQGEENGTAWSTWDAMRQPNETGDNLDAAFFDTLIDCLAVHLEVDEKRLYVAGLSAGGIMANRVLRARSDLLAGGVVASGIFDLTAAEPPPALEGMAVLVTWGGDTDEYSEPGRPSFNFVEQAALASQHYEEAENVHQIYCTADVGHKWLAAVNELMVDYLLAHPNGAAFTDSWTLVSPDASTGITCSEEAASFTPSVVVTCSAQTEPDCQAYCQGIADCVVENATVRPVLEPQLTALGFSGEGQTDCAGCVTQCEADLAAGGATVDGAVLDCMATELGAAQCTSGIQGVLPFTAVVDTCCDGQTESEVCGRLCEAILENTTATTFFPVCNAWAPAL